MAKEDKAPEAPPPTLSETEVANFKADEEAKKRAKEAQDANAAREFAALAAAEGTGFAVAAGTSITTRRGLVDAGQAISELDFVGGKADLDDLIRRGAIVKK